MTAVDVRRIPQRRPGRPLPPATPDADDEPLPVTRPATSLGWAPPYTDTPDEIEDRRNVLLGANRRADYGQAHHSAAEWDAAIRDALTDLTAPAAPAA